MLVLLLSVAFLRKNDSFAYNLVLLESVCAVSFAGFARKNTAYRKVGRLRNCVLAPVDCEISTLMK